MKRAKVFQAVLAVIGLDAKIYRFIIEGMFRRGKLKRIRFGRRGFSLVELLTVIAIIGIMVTIAGPQFSVFVSKARQTEAKAMLTAAYVVQTAFFGESGSYTVCLGPAGYQPTNARRVYTMGFHDLDFTYVGCGPSANQPCNIIDWNSNFPCAPAASEGVNRFTATSGVPGMATLDSLPTDLTARSFVMCAAGAISGSPPSTPLGFDAWCINNLKVLENVVSEM